MIENIELALGVKSERINEAAEISMEYRNLHGISVPATFFQGGGGGLKDICPNLRVANVTRRHNGLRRARIF